MAKELAGASKARSIAYAGLVFICGFIVGVKLSVLIPLGESYRSEWWEVGMATFFGIFFSILAHKEGR